MHSAVALYLDLLKKSVLEDLYVENEVRLLYLRRCIEGTEQFSLDVYLHIGRERSNMLAEYVQGREIGMNYGRTINNLGFQHTMIGRRRLENIEFCLDRIQQDKVAGDCIECGVWRGGAAIFMRGYLAAHEIEDKVVWVADSFAGVPPPSLEQDKDLDLSVTRYPMLAIDLETVRSLFERYGLLDQRVRFLPGWFKDTLPSAPIRALSLLRLDGDLYESTMEGLEALYGKLSPGGYVIIDDFGCLLPCRQAVEEFRSRHGISEPITEVDWTGAFWRKAG